jgi:hypothetical protein
MHAVRYINPYPRCEPLVMFMRNLSRSYARFEAGAHEGKQASGFTMSKFDNEGYKFWRHV